MYSTLNQILLNNDKHAVSAETLVSLEGFVFTQAKKEQWMATLVARQNACAGAPKAPATPPSADGLSAIPKPLPLSLPLPLPSVNASIVDANANVIANTHTNAMVERKQNPDIFSPTQENTLFWSLFVGVYGYSDYLNIAHKYHNAEIEEKQALVEKLGKTPRRLKETNHRITNQSIQELLSGVMVAKHDTLFSLIAYSVYYERQVVVLFENNTYIRFIPETASTSNTSPVFLHCRVGARRNLYSVELEPGAERMSEVAEQAVELESYLKPLKGVSAYKMPELEEIAKKVGVIVDAKQKKGDLYDKIAAKCSLEKIHANER